MRRIVWMVPLLLAGCASRKAETLLPLVEEFVYSSLAFSPVGATGAGYHEHQGRRLDELLDDFSPAALEAQRAFYRSFQQRLAAFRPEQLAPEELADYEILRGQIALALLELDSIQNFRHNPTVYVELLGNAFFYPHVLEYAPLAERVRHIIARLEKVPGFLEQAKKNLADAPEIWTAVAVEENDGNLRLIDKLIRAALPAEQRAEYDRAAGVALPALREFNAWLKNDLAKRPGDWRLGKDKYALKFRHVLGTDQTPEQVLARAEADLKSVRERMYELARPLHRKWFPRHEEHADVNTLVGETLARIADRHSTAEAYMDDAKRDLAEAREFVRAKALLPLPPRDNLGVIPTPEFMRGIYAVGGFQPAPPLEPQLGAFYWITPIPKDWPKARIESKLREYNFYKLKLLTIHEAMPGHYVQFEYANDVQPRPRRLLRALYGSGTYVEGWAEYAAEMVLEAGFLDQAPELWLTFLKQELRVISNAILDIRLHTLGMTDQQALDLMIKETFQEREEATAKLRRAKLSSCQLPTYYVGWRDLVRVRDHYRRHRGAEFRVAEFNERVLKAGAVPLPVLARLLTGSGLSAR
jgi:uncharacterized protein (DUF885 family)